MVKSYVRVVEDFWRVLGSVNPLPQKFELTIWGRARQLERYVYGKGRVLTTMGSGIEIEEAGTASGQGQVRMHHDRGLLMIGFFKLIEAVFFFLVGVGAIHFIHRDLGDAAQRLAERLKFDLDGRMMSWVMDHLDEITAHRLRQIGAVTFFYSGLRIVEGAGLVMEKVWAEHLTVAATCTFLPWEVYEIIRHPDWLRVCLLLTNLAVLAYLVWSLQHSRAARLAARGMKAN